ncbi:MAG: ACP S-malonyltransferase [Myxococcales bacterium]|nr:ACP S-malonyltransferase [Myxococcales bacterium]
MATFVFPGQGSQRVGMAREIVEASPLGAALFRRASAALSLDLVAVCDSPQVNETEYTQPAIVAISVALAQAFIAATGVEATLLAGHSLGEYSALVVAGAVPFGSALRLVRRRGQLMQEASGDVGAMAAVVQKPLQLETIGRIIAECGVALANHNSPSQVVLSGPRSQLELALDRLRAACPKPRLIAIPLKVSAAFHSDAMHRIEAPFRAALIDEQPSFAADRALRVYSNAHRRAYDGRPSDLLEGLVGQLAASVDWLDAMEQVRGASPPIVEIGPSAPLSRFFKEIGVVVDVVSDIASVGAWRPEERG